MQHLGQIFGGETDPLSTTPISSDRFLKLKAWIFEKYMENYSNEFFSKEARIKSAIDLLLLLDRGNGDRVFSLNKRATPRESFVRFKEP